MCEKWIRKIVKLIRVFLFFFVWFLTLETSLLFWWDAFFFLVIYDILIELPFSMKLNCHFMPNEWMMEEITAVLSRTRKKGWAKNAWKIDDSNIQIWVHFQFGSFFCPTQKSSKNRWLGHTNLHSFSIWTFLTRPDKT